MNEGKRGWGAATCDLCRVLVTNETNNETTSTTPGKATGGVRKRKLRRVRSLIKTSIDKLTTERANETTPKKTQSNATGDRRPFPFGQW